uniref:Uncharacterized protein n=1 Tax=Caenorhabditis japonica TaxID=281687 RepID=A0A8R1E4F1_CAEJA
MYGSIFKKNHEESKNVKISAKKAFFVEN